MQSYQSIQDQKDERTEEAREQELAPISAADLLPHLARGRNLPVPFLGDHVQTGWVVAKDIDGDTIDLLVDSSGFGSDSEPALTVAQFQAKVEALARDTAGAAWGLGIVEAGQFQVVIRLYRTDPRDFTHTGALSAFDLNKLGR